MKKRSLLFYLFITLLCPYPLFGEDTGDTYNYLPNSSAIGNSWGSYYDRFNNQTINPYYGTSGSATGTNYNSTSASKTVSLVDFLYTQCFGKLVQITDNSGNIVGEGVTKELIIREDAYFLVLTNDQRLTVVFETGGSKNPALPINANQSSSQQEIMQKRLQMEQMLSTSIANLDNGDESNSTASQVNTSLSSLSNQPNSFTPSGRICYYDKILKLRKIEEIMITNDTIYLRDGSPIKFRLER